MKTEKMRDKDLRDALRNFEIQPSPGVWERISAADIAPVAKPRNIRYLLMGAAAVMLVTSLLLWYFSGDKSTTDIEDSVGITEPSGNNQEFAQQKISEPLSKPSEQTDRNYQENQGSAIAPVRGSGHEPALDGASAPVATDKSLPSQPKQVRLPEPVQSTKQTPPVQKEPAEVKNPGEQGVAETTLQKEAASGEVSADVKVTALEVFIPSAFTPDNDGINDYFLPVIQNNTEVREYRMQIFARNGTLLFESVNQEIGWDGRHLGVMVDDPVCIYVISFRDPDGNPYLRRGTITIIK